jgi:hypothetical protein
MYPDIASRMLVYIRKAGIDIRGITDVLSLHNPSGQVGQIVSIAEKR